MLRRVCEFGCAALLGAFLLSGMAAPAPAQEIRTIIQARDRAFTTVGPGVTALKRDSAGRYYVLSKPASVISIYLADGKPAGQIPNAQSKGATIKYAVDIDISPDGLLLVADRGANAVYAFKPDGSLIATVSVTAPSSVVALSGGQFAVTSLVSKRLVQVRDLQGNMVRSFGDPTDVGDGVTQKPIMDMGRITGDSGEHVYFAFTSVDDPTLRSYDRYGYVGYEAKVPENAFANAPRQAADRYEVGLTLNHFSFSDQLAGTVSLGSSGDLKYSGGVGTGLLGASRFGGGGGFGGGGFGGGGRAGILQAGGGLYGGGIGGQMGAPLSGTISGEVTSQGETQFQFGVGSSGGRGGGRGRFGGGSSSGQTTSQGAMLQFNGAGDGGYDDIAKLDLSNAFSSGTQQGANGDSADGPFAGVNLLPYGDNDGPPVGLTSAFAIATLSNSVGFRGPRPSGGFANDIQDGGTTGGPGIFGPGSADAGTTTAVGKGGASSTGSAGPSGSGKSSGTAPAAGAGAGAGGYGHYGHGGGFSQNGVTVSMRVNLGDLGGGGESKPAITAVVVDPVTHEIWAGVGDALVHFNKSGDPMEMYYLTMKGGGSLKATAVLVESDRILVAGDPWGIFEFARPDKPILTAPLRFNAVPERVTPPQQ
jgi:hypothetical protein